MCISVALGLQAWCILMGWYLLAQGMSKDCEALHQWLLGYCIALTMLPFCITVAGPLVVWWAANGLLIRSGMSSACQRSSPMLWNFVDEVLYSSLGTCGCMLVALLLLWLIRRRTHQMNVLWGSSGPTVQAVVQHILDGPAHEPTPGTECSICLESGSRESRWRALTCGHPFHEHCLVEWLQRARRCPLCRLDLHASYLGHASGVSNLEAGQEIAAAV